MPLLFVLLDAPATLQYASTDKYWRYAAQLKQSLISGGLDSNYLVAAATPQDAAARAPADGSLGVAGNPLEWKGAAAETTAPQDSLPSQNFNDAEETISLFRSVASARPADAGNHLQLQHGVAAPRQNSYCGSIPCRSFPRLVRVRHERRSGRDPYRSAKYSSARGLSDERSRRRYPPLCGRRFFRRSSASLRANPPRACARESPRYFSRSSHRRTILGIVDWRSGASLSDAVSRETQNLIARDFNRTLSQIDRVATLANIPAELADPGAQSSAVLGHNPVILLVVPESLRGKQFLSVSAQESLLEFVRAGGALICNPDLPLGDQFSDALAKVDALPAADGVTVRILGEGRIIVWSKIFFDWVNPDESVSGSRAHLESAWAVENLRTLVSQQSSNLPVVRSTPSSDALAVSELVPNRPGSSSADSSSPQCRPAQQCTQGVLSVANWSDSEIQETLRIMHPAISERTAQPEDYVELPVTVRPHDALFLPLDVPLCSAARKYEPCNDRVIAAGAEFVGATREGRFLELTFYSPSTATIVLHLAAPPRHLELPERTLQGQYVVAAQTFTMSLPRGSAPDFLRTVKIDLPYTPFVPEVPKPEHSKSHAYTFSVANAVRLPLGEGASLATNPPLVYLAPDLGGRACSMFKIWEIRCSHFTSKSRE